MYREACIINRNEGDQRINMNRRYSFENLAERTTIDEYFRSRERELLASNSAA